MTDRSATGERQWEELFARAAELRASFTEQQRAAARILATTTAVVGEARRASARREMARIELELAAKEARATHPRAALPPARARLDSAVLEERFLRAAPALLGLSQGGFAMVSAGEHLGVLAESQATFSGVDDLQFSLGEGPALDAAASGREVQIADLGLAYERWPAFAPAAQALGVRAVLCIPLVASAAATIVVTLYGNRRVKEFLDGCEAAGRLGRIAMHIALLRLEATGAGEVPRVLALVSEARAPIHRATGMVSDRFTIDAGAALRWLRLRAWAEGRDLAEVAADVIGRRIDLDDATR